MNLRRTLRPTGVLAAAALAVGALSIMAPLAVQPATSPPKTGPAAAIHDDQQAQRGKEWVAAWRAAPQQPISGVSKNGFSNQTVRMVVRPDVTGHEVRVRLSNAYGTDPVEVGHASVATQAGGPSIASDTLQTITVDGQADFSIPPGAEVVSDPVDLRVKREQSLVISLFFPEPSGPATFHRWAESTTYISQAGDWADEPGGSPYQTMTPSWFFLAGVDVKGPPVAGTVVAFGDSITDGHFATIDGNGRYTDWLGRRTPRHSVVNAGIGGNKILSDKATGGESALNRLDRDMINQLGVTDVILMQGINDIAAGRSADEVIDGIQQIIASAHDNCLNIIGGTLTAWEGSSAYNATRESVREEVNDWIRTGDAFDGVIDFDEVTRDPANPHALRAEYDTGGGHIHPNDLGYKAMADAVDLDLLTGQGDCS